MTNVLAYTPAAAAPTCASQTGANVWRKSGQLRAVMTASAAAAATSWLTAAPAMPKVGTSKKSRGRITAAISDQMVVADQTRSWTCSTAVYSSVIPRNSPCRPSTRNVPAPAADPPGLDPWEDLWFYANPIFVRERQVESGK